MAHFVWNGWAICPVMAQVGSHQSLRVVLLHPCPASVDIMRTNFDEFWAEKTWFPP